MSKKIWVRILIVIIVMLGIFAFNNGEVSATSGSVTIKYKLERLWSCINNGAYAKSWKTSELKTSGFVQHNYSDPFANTQGVPISGGLSCYNVLFGGDGVLPNNIKNIDTTQDASGKTIADYFSNAGYSANAKNEKVSGDEQNLTYKVTEYNGSSTSSGTTITFPAVGIVNGGLSVDQNSSYNVPYPGTGGSEKFSLPFSGHNFSIIVRDTGAVDQPSWAVTGSDGSSHQVTVNSSGAYEFQSSFSVGITGDAGQSIVLSGTTGKVQASNDGHTVEYFMYWQGDANKMLTGINANFGSYGDIALTKQEVYDLYRDYVTNTFKATVVCENDSNYDSYSNVGTYINWNTCGKCKIDKDSAVDVKVLGVDSNYHLNKLVTLDDVIITLSAMNIQGLSGADSCSAKPTNPTNTPAGLTDALACDELVKKTSPDEKIGAMQWILCPTMDNTRYTASWVDEITDDWLSVDTSLYGQGTDTETVWGQVRNIANVVMVIFLLAIILSQLTGRGIDNYGIKKMLPRLIVMAIIVNLSFYACAIAIDLSNIAGAGLRNMFGSLGNMLGQDAISGTSFIGSMVTGIFATAGGATTAVGAGITLVSLGAPVTVAVIIAVIVLCLVILVAVVTLFIMLGVREILIVVCVILAPLAFAAFILPNTQNLFKKWWNLFKTALIIYPICGAMSGISYLLRSMAAGGKMQLGMWGFAVLMVLPYLVFFLIPSLLKEALGALGKIGGALTSMGQTIRNGGRQLGQAGAKVAQNSQRFKDLQKEAARRQEQQRVNRVMQKFGDGRSIEDRLEDARNRMANSQEGTREHSAAMRDLQRAQTDQRRFYEAQQTHYKMEAEQQVAGTSPEVLAARAQSTQESLEFKNISDQFANASTDQIRVALTSAENTYAGNRSSANATRLRAMQAVAMNKGMNSRVLEGLNNPNLALNGNNENDQKVLNSINYGNLYSGLTRSELGAELQGAVNAYSADRNVSNMNRLQNIIKAADGRGMDKEMLSHLGGLSLQANDANGRATNDARILDTMSGVNNKVLKQYGIQMGKPTNTQQNMSMDQFASSTGPVKLSEALAGKGESYLNDANDDTLHYIAEQSMAGGAYNPVISAGTLANITANTTDEKVLREARQIYGNMNADDISFSGSQLAKYDLETLRTIATKITPNSQLQRNFVAATNDIANNIELMSGLRPEQRALFKAIRSGAGVNDNLFD